MRPTIDDEPAPREPRDRLRLVGGGGTGDSGPGPARPGLGRHGTDPDDADLDGADLDATDGEPGWVPPQRSSLGHRLTSSGPWGELAERWVPEPLRGARVDPSRRGAIAVAVIAVIAAGAAALAVWWLRPTPEPVAPAEPVPVESAPLVVSGSAETDDPGTAGADSDEPPVDRPTGPILVSVTGEVLRPGLVTVAADARVADAIAAAGGALDIRDLTGLNLAARLSDGDSIVVAGPSGSVISSDPDRAGGAAGGPAADAGLVDINTADTTALQELPGVGPVTAEAIIAYRTDHGPFVSGEQLQEVSGIGPATMARLGPLITW